MVRKERVNRGWIRKPRREGREHRERDDYHHQERQEKLYALCPSVQSISRFWWLVFQRRCHPTPTHLYFMSRLWWLVLERRCHSAPPQGCRGSILKGTCAYYEKILAVYGRYTSIYTILGGPLECFPICPCRIICIILNIKAQLYLSKR